MPRHLHGGKQGLAMPPQNLHPPTLPESGSSRPGVAMPSHELVARYQSPLSHAVPPTLRAS